MNHRISLCLGSLLRRRSLWCTLALLAFYSFSLHAQATIPPRAYITNTGANNVTSSILRPVQFAPQAPA
jgi:hypothetical protein